MAEKKNVSAKKGWRKVIKAIPGFCIPVAIGTLAWIFWNEAFDWPTLVQGLVFSAAAFGITGKYLLKSPYHRVFRIGPLMALKYLAVLIVSIFQSGIHAMYITINGKIDISVVDIPTATGNPFHGVLIGTAITLTPGTVTIDYRPGWYKVIWIEAGTADPVLAGKQIKGRFEAVFNSGLRDNEQGGKQ